MHQSTVSKAHLMLGRMHIHVHQRRLQFEIEHKGRMPPVKEHILIRLLDGMTDQLVADDAPVHVEVLQIRLTARKRWQTDPAPQTQT